MPNLYEPDFDGGREEPGFTNRRAQLGRQAGSERLGASLIELPPGQAAFPMHYHLGNEELAFVIEGSPSLRTPQDERVLIRGEVVAFPVGEHGVHQIVNRSDAPARFLIVSEMNAPDVVIRPESNSISAFGRAPGSDPESGYHEAFRREDAVDLWDPEAPPPPAP